MIQPNDSVVLGPPGGLSHWMFAVVRALVGHATNAQDLEVVEIGVGQNAPDAGGKQRILLYHYPTQELLDAISQSELRIIYLAEDPIEIVDYLCKASDRNLVDAIRVCSASLTANIALRSAPNALVLNRHLEHALKVILEASCAHLGIRIAAQALDAYCAHILPARPEGTFELEAAVQRVLPVTPRSVHLQDESQVAIVDSILQPLVMLTLQRDIQSIVWPQSVFYGGTGMDLVSGPVELAGPKRALYHGPYLHMPPSSYTVDFAISVSGIYRTVGLQLKVLAVQGALATVRFDVPGNGDFSGQMRLEWSQLAGEMQAQVLTETGEIEGVMQLHRVTWTPTPP